MGRRDEAIIGIEVRLQVLYTNVGYLECTGNNEKEISVASLRLTVNFSPGNSGA